MEQSLSLPGQSATLSRIHETSAKFQRYKILLRRRWWFLLLTASIGVCVQALRITGKPQSFISLAKLVAGGRMVGGTGAGGVQYQDYIQDFYGTIIETIESSEMRRRALDQAEAELLNGLVYSDVLIIAVNPKQTKLGLLEVEYVGHLVSATGTSFTPEKRLKVLDFPQPTTQKEMLQFIGLANYFRDHVPNMTEMVKPLRDMIPLGKYQRTCDIVRTIDIL
jgi:hypothetical protein